MILTCPRCATRYLAEDEDVGPAGRQVRCSAGREEWRAFPDTEAPEAADTHDESAWRAAEPEDTQGQPSLLLNDAPPEPQGDLGSASALPELALVSPIGALRATPAPRPRTSAAQLMFLGLPVLVALLAAGYALREEVVRAIPAARPAYAALGIPLGPTAPPAPPHE
jgi:predicted Zn finger-like uncharacterized protein